MPFYGGTSVAGYSSIDMIAGSRTMTPDGTLQTYTTNAVGPDGLVWPGPAFANFKKRIPLGAIIGGPPGATYYRCRFGFPNWMQSAGVNLATVATASSGSTALTSVGSTAGVKPGMTITGSGIPVGTLVAAVATGALTLSQATTAALSGTAVTIRSTPGFYGNNTGEVAQTGGPLQIAAGVRPIFGNTDYAPLPITFGGNEVGTVPTGATVFSDWVYGRFVPGTDIELVTSVFWGPGTQLYGSHMARADLGEAANFVYTATAPQFGSTSDYTGQANPNWSGFVSNYVYGPASVQCSTYAPAAVQRSFATFGDSTARGTGDGYTFQNGNFQFIGDAAGFVGPAARMGEALGVAHMNASQPGKTLAALLTSWQLGANLLAGGPTHVILQLGVNDAAGGASLATMQTNWINAVNMIQGAGYKVIATTLSTMTTTTDNGATTANQTPTAGFAVNGVARQFNDWLRSTGAPTYTPGRLLDFADATMSSRNSQLWRTDIVPFADWGGYLSRLTWVAGSGGTNGTYTITSTGGGATTPASITVTVSGGSIASVLVNSTGIGATSALTFSTASITGLTGGSFTSLVRPLTTGIHFNSMRGLTGATLTNLGTVQSGGAVVDANGAIATYLLAQLNSALSN